MAYIYFVLSYFKNAYNHLPDKHRTDFDKADLRLMIKIGLILLGCFFLVFSAYTYFSDQRQKTISPVQKRYNTAKKEFQLEKQRLQNVQTTELVKLNQQDKTLSQLPAWQGINNALKEGSESFPLKYTSILFAVDGMRIGCQDVIVENNCLRLNQAWTAELSTQYLSGKDLNKEVMSWQDQINQSRTSGAHVIAALTIISAQTREFKQSEKKYKTEKTMLAKSKETNDVKIDFAVVASGVSGIIFLIDLVFIICAVASGRNYYKKYRKAQRKMVARPINKSPNLAAGAAAPVVAPKPSSKAPVAKEPLIEEDEPAKNYKRYTAEEILTSRRVHDKY